MSSYPRIKSYQDALNYILGGKSKTERTLPGVRATVVRFDHTPANALPDMVIKQHTTDIITYRADGSIVVNSGGWRTYTTKDRINGLSPARVSQEAGVWYIATRPDPLQLQTYENRRAQRSLFEDGMVLDADGYPLHPVKPDAEEGVKKRLDKAVSKYIAATVKAVVEAKAMPEPSSGDCLYCQMAVPGRSTPQMQAKDQVDHYLSHMGLGREEDAAEEWYVPLGSLIWLAYQRHGNPAFVWSMADGASKRGEEPTSLANNLRYFFRQLKPAMVKMLVERAADAVDEQMAAGGGR